MPTFVKRVENNRVLIQVAAAVEADGSELDHRFMALVDTGTTVTAVTSRLAQQVGVAPRMLAGAPPKTASSQADWRNK